MKIARETRFLVAFLVLNAISCSEKTRFVDHPAGEDYLAGTGGGDVEIPNDDGGGGGPGPRIRDDRFRQAADGKMDILWVIDNSASMEPYQNALITNIRHFLDRAKQWRGDVQMAVTSTDMCPAVRPENPGQVLCPDRMNTVPGLQGRFVENRIVKGLDDAAVYDFSRISRVGTTGSSFEHGLSAVRQALQLSVNGGNPEFMRPGAHLAVVLVSDERDDGVGLSQFDEQGFNWFDSGLTSYSFSARDLHSFLKNIRPDGQFAVNSIVGQAGGAPVNSGCVGGETIEAGTEQMEASRLTGGMILDLCGRDWPAGLSKLADHIGSALRTFRLSAIPRPVSSIRVFVGGVEVKSGWKYNMGANSITFAPGSIPESGAEIIVRYGF